MVRRLAIGSVGLVLGLAPFAACAGEEKLPPVVNGATWTQHQILAAKVRYPQIRAILVTGKRPGDTAAVVLGSTANPSAVFGPAPAETGSAETTVSGGAVIVREPYLNSTGHLIGTIAISFARPGGGGTAPLVGIAKAVAHRLMLATLSAKNAADPYPYDRAWGPDTYAQQLVERTVRRHPDLVVMMIHATPPGSRTNIVIGSNIGRFGKVADEDDLRVIDKGETNLEVADEKDRFETELPLNDASGKRIGALGLVFHYRDGADREALHRHGLAIRDELARQIPNSAALFRRTGPAEARR